VTQRHVRTFPGASKCLPPKAQHVRAIFLKQLLFGFSLAFHTKDKAVRKVLRDCVPCLPHKI